MSASNHVFRTIDRHIDSWLSKNQQCLAAAAAIAPTSSSPSLGVGTGGVRVPAAPLRPLFYQDKHRERARGSSGAAAAAAASADTVGATQTTSGQQQRQQQPAAYRSADSDVSDSDGSENDERSRRPGGGGGGGLFSGGPPRAEKDALAALTKQVGTLTEQLQQLSAALRETSDARATAELKHEFEMRTMRGLLDSVIAENVQLRQSSSVNDRLATLEQRVSTNGQQQVPPMIARNAAEKAPVPDKQAAASSSIAFPARVRLSQELGVEQPRQSSASSSQDRDGGGGGGGSVAAAAARALPAPRSGTNSPAPALVQSVTMAPSAAQRTTSDREASLSAYRSQYLIEQARLDERFAKPSANISPLEPQPFTRSSSRMAAGATAAAVDGGTPVPVPVSARGRATAGGGDDGTASEDVSCSLSTTMDQPPPPRDQQRRAAGAGGARATGTLGGGSVSATTALSTPRQASDGDDANDSDGVDADDFDIASSGGGGAGGGAGTGAAAGGGGGGEAAPRGSRAALSPRSAAPRFAAPRQEADRSDRTPDIPAVPARAPVADSTVPQQQLSTTPVAQRASGLSSHAVTPAASAERIDPADAASPNSFGDDSCVVSDQSAQTPSPRSVAPAAATATGSAGGGAVVNGADGRDRSESTATTTTKTTRLHSITSPAPENRETLYPPSVVSVDGSTFVRAGPRAGIVGGGAAAASVAGSGFARPGAAGSATGRPMGFQMSRFIAGALDDDDADGNISANDDDGDGGLVVQRPIGVRAPATATGSLLMARIGGAGAATSPLSSAASSTHGSVPRLGAVGRTLLVGGNGGGGGGGGASTAVGAGALHPPAPDNDDDDDDW